MHKRNKSLFNKFPESKLSIKTSRNRNFKINQGHINKKIISPSYLGNNVYRAATTNGGIFSADTFSMDKYNSPIQMAKKQQRFISNGNNVF